MGQHTWFYKESKASKRIETLYEWADDSSSDEEGSAYMEAIDKIDELIETNYHDEFRTNKSGPDESYIEDVILTSKQECIQWIKDNIETVYYLNYDRLLEFWEKYPDGCIKFG